MSGRTDWQSTDQLPDLTSPNLPVTCVEVPSLDNLKNLYAQLPELFAKDIVKQEAHTRHDIPAPSTPVGQFSQPTYATPTSAIVAPSVQTPMNATGFGSNMSGGGSNAPSPVNSIGFGTSMKRERPDAFEDVGSPSPVYKRRDTGEGKHSQNMMMPPPPPPSSSSVEPPSQPRTPTQQHPPSQHGMDSNAAVGEPLGMGGMGAGLFPQTQPPSSGLGDLSNSGLFPPGQNPSSSPPSTMPQGNMDPQLVARLQMRQQHFIKIQQAQQQGIPLNPQQQQFLAHYQNGSMQNQQHIQQQMLLARQQHQQQQSQQQPAQQEISLTPAGAIGIGGLGSMQQTPQQGTTPMGMSGMGAAPTPGQASGNILAGLDNATIAQIQAIGPQAMSALTILQTQPSHVIVRFLHAQIPAFGSLPVVQQIQRFLMVHVSGCSSTIEKL